MRDGPSRHPTGQQAEVGVAGLWPSWLLQAPEAGLTTTECGGPYSDCDTIVTLAQRHHVAPLLFLRLRSAPVDHQPPPEMLQRLKTLHLAAAARSMPRERELQDVLAALASAGITPTPFKGAALAHTVYPTPACRPMGDLDLWVDEPQMSEAVRALERAGYATVSQATRPLPLQRDSEGEIKLVARGGGRALVELHWGVFGGQWLQRASAVDSAAVAARRVPGRIVGHDVLLLAPEDDVIQLAVHLAVNHQMSMPLRALVDIALLDARGLNWALVAQRATAWRLATVVGTVLTLLVDLFGAGHVSAGLCATASRLPRSRLARQAARRLASPRAFLDGLRLSSSHWRYVFLLAMVDRPSDRRRLLGRALWPEPAWLEARYGRRNLSTRLAHAAGALRGRL